MLAGILTGVLRVAGILTRTLKLAATLTGIFVLAKTLPRIPTLARTFAKILMPTSAVISGEIEDSDEAPVPVGTQAAAVEHGLD